MVCLHVGQLLRRGLHFEQILCPFLHRFIGGVMHSKHTGHSKRSGKHCFNTSSALPFVGLLLTDKDFPLPSAILEHSFQ
jgi:hypothetical protein